MGTRTARALRPFWTVLLDIKEGIISIMGQIEDLKTANAAEASAVLDALAALKADAEQHAADVAALAAKAADNPDLSGLASEINGRAASIRDAIAALHGTISTAATGTATDKPATDPAPAADPVPAADPAPDAAKAS